MHKLTYFLLKKSCQHNIKIQSISEYLTLHYVMNNYDRSVCIDFIYMYANPLIKNFI